MVAPEVRRALAEGRPVVALETTIICHGIPRPDNVRLALEIERAVRAEGAVPAATAVLDGAIRVGLAEDELQALAASDRVIKCTTRDLPRMVASRRAGATTVAATLFIAAQSGIPVMATGGIGGVHRGGEASFDVSADLEELARRSAMVVASGIKTILDLPRTMERLESLGVPVIGLGTAELPGLYTATSGLSVPRAGRLEEITAQFRVHRALNLPGALLVVQPPPPELALAAGEVEHLVARARERARAAGISGPDETPFLLRAMAEDSGGRTVRLNCALALANAALAARLAVALG